MMPRTRALTLERQGLIKVRVAGDRHCGTESSVVDGTVPVRYTVRLVVDAAGMDPLDDRGFLVDQEALHTALSDIGMDPVPWREPCEVLTFVWSDRLLTWISTQNTRCDIREFSLTLSPSPHAGAFTAHYGSHFDSAALAKPALRAVA